MGSHLTAHNAEDTPPLCPRRRRRRRRRRRTLSPPFLFWPLPTTSAMTTTLIRRRFRALARKTDRRHRYVFVVIEREDFGEGRRREDSPFSRDGRTLRKRSRRRRRKKKKKKKTTRTRKR